MLKQWLTFNTKGWPLRRLPDTGEHVEVHVSPHSLDQTNGGGALTLTQRSGGDAADRRTFTGQDFCKKKKKTASSFFFAVYYKNRTKYNSMKEKVLCV